MDKKTAMKREIPWDLIVARLKKEITAEDDIRLGRWLSDSGNGKVFDELQLLWEKIQGNASNYMPDKEFYWKELSKRVGLPDVGAPLQPHRRIGWWRYAAAVCAVVVVSAAFYIGSWVGVPEDVVLDYTNLSGKSMASLPDRTAVWLHNDTRLSCDMPYRKDERLVTLQGEAFFDVSHNKAKPFIVQTDGMRIVVHGTKFNVEAFPDAENIYVSLLEGAVSLETGQETRPLHPGEMATYNRKSHRLSIARGDVAYAASWMKDELQFTQRSLRDICRFLSKWYHVKVDLVPEVADAFYYTFTLRNETLEEILRLMAYIHPIAYDFTKEDELKIYKKQ